MLKKITVLAVLGLLLTAARDLRATEREARTEIEWRRTLPRMPEAGAALEKPLLVYVVSEVESRDQERFEQVALENETFQLATKFFECVRVHESTAKNHPLLEKLRFSTPGVVVFDSTLEKHAVAGGRASGMKIYGVMCKIGQLDYQTSIAATVRAARNLLGTFDRVDAAQDALGVKGERLEEAVRKGDQKKAHQLEREMEAQQREIDALFEKAEKRWREIWTLERKER